MRLPRPRRALALLLALGWAPALLAYVDGPLPAHTGGFGEPTCHACHFDQPLAPPGARLSVAGFPPSYTPGERYLLTLRLDAPGLRRGGFELAVRAAEGEGAGAQAGALSALDERVRILAAGRPAVEYAQHTLAGTRPAAGRLSWRVAWTAPARPAPAVVLHVAANAANDDASPLGDRIVLATVISRGILPLLRSHQ